MRIFPKNAAILTVRRLGIWCMAVVGIAVSYADAPADRSLRCAGRIVSIGATPQEVLGACGDPDHREQWEEGHGSAISQIFDYEKERYTAPRLIIGPIRMERWTYDLGANRFIRYLLFQNGKLIQIETGDKGTD